MQHIAAVCEGNQVINYVGGKTRSKKKAKRVADSVRPNLKPGLEVRPLTLNSFTRQSLAMFGSWNGQ